MKKLTIHSIQAHVLFVCLLAALGLMGNGPATLLYIICMLWYWRQHSWWVALLVALPLHAVITFIGQRGFIPYPDPVLVIISLLISLVFTLPFLLDRLGYRYFPLWLRLILFPSCAHIFNLYFSKGPTGSMGYFGNLFHETGWLMQWSAYIGIFGIGFLLYLFSILAVELIESFKKESFDWRLFTSMFTLLLLLMTLGRYREIKGISNSNALAKTRVAAISIEQTDLSEALVWGHEGIAVKISREMSPADPIQARISNALVDWKDHAGATRYQKVQSLIISRFEHLRELTQKASEQGAKIIVWSEGALICTKQEEMPFILQMQEVARQNQVYLFMAMASMIPDVSFPEHPIVENKILVIGPDGTLLDTYFKNVPVPDIDPSVPGDGIMRAINTPYGKIAYAICYDADFPDLMREVGRLGTDLLVVPTGDWKALSPYHTHATNIRSIENGFTQLRAVSSGLSSAVDAYGNYHATHDFFAHTEHLMLADIPIKKVNTAFTYFGELFTIISFAIMVFAVLLLLKRFY